MTMTFSSVALRAGKQPILWYKQATFQFPMFFWVFTNFFENRGPRVNSFLYSSYILRTLWRALFIVYFCYREVVHSTVCAVREAGDPEIGKCRHAWPLHLTWNICSQKVTNEIMSRKPGISLLLGIPKITPWL